MKYYPMHMHLHSCHQPGASMESHIYNAKTLGMEYIRFTDHDTRVCKKQNGFNSFDFSREEFKYVYSSDEYVKLITYGKHKPYFEDGTLKMFTYGEDDPSDSTKIELYTSGKNHTYALLSEVTLTLGFEHKIVGEGRIIIEIRLSQRPPEHKHARLRYVIGEIYNNEELTKEIKLDERADGIYHLNITEDMKSLHEIGGLDNVFDTVSIILESKPENECYLTLSRLEIESKLSGDEVLRKQRSLAKKIGEKYGVYPFVTSEISGAGQHKNVFSEKVSLIEYEKYNYKLSEEDAVNLVKEQGGIFAYNHPFENNKYKRREFSREDIENIINEETKRLSENRIFGATLMEVGFPEGRGLFTLSDYLKLWDNFSLLGIFITGYGDSDSHYSDKAWFDHNNFATYVGLSRKSNYPATEEEITKAYKSGNVYMGDPTRLHTELIFKSDETLMGGVIQSPLGESRFFEVRFSNIDAGSEVKIIADGEVLYNEKQSSDGYYAKCFDFTPKKEVSFIRVELYDKDSRCILLSNPIYLVADDFPKCDIPKERISPKYEVKIPKGAETIKGTKLLHISDTDSRLYPYYKKLIATINPDIILHTGDMSDEVKVGRMPETRDEYLSKIKIIIDYMKKSGARVIIVPGNNDLPDEIKRLAPFAEVYPKNTVIELDGAECRIGHQVMNMTFDKKWHFYGHGYTGEEWSNEKNVSGGECRFNACECTFLVSIKENKFYFIDNPRKFD